MGLSQEQKDARIDFAQEVYTRTLSTRRTQVAIQKEFGLKSRAARKVIEALKARWANEAALEGDPETRRNELREAGRAAYERALRRRMVVHNADGTPALYPEGHPRAGEPVTREDPDLQHAMRALEYLARLDGLTNTTVRLNVPGLVEAIDAVTLESDSDPDA